MNSQSQASLRNANNTKGVRTDNPINYARYSPMNICSKATSITSVSQHTVGFLIAASFLKPLPLSTWNETITDGLSLMDISLKNWLKSYLGFQGALLGTLTPNQDSIGEFMHLSTRENRVFIADVQANENFANYGITRTSIYACWQAPPFKPHQGLAIACLMETAAECTR